jgi:Na+/H+-translocating membrane pyrophosphatase
LLFNFEKIKVNLICINKILNKIKFRFGIDLTFKTCVRYSSQMSIVMMSISYFSFILFVLLFKSIGLTNKNTFEIMCGYGFGFSFSALFCRISGGIFTKGADISCDIVGKIEHNLFENDPRNPTSIADNVGDLIGDLSASILDLIASIGEAFIAIFLIVTYMENLEEDIFNYILFFFSLFITCQLIFIISELSLAYTNRNSQIISDSEIEGYLFKLLHLTTISMIIITIFSFILIIPSQFIFKGLEISNIFIMSTVLLGLCSGYLICYSTYYYTGKSFQSIQQLAKLTVKSPSLNVIYGLSIGFYSTVAPTIIIAITVLISDLFYGIFGVAFASFGILLNLPVILVFQMFGPMSDVTLGVINIVRYDSMVRKLVNQLDITGNTMSAVVKGYATGCGGLVSFGLYGAIMLRGNFSEINLNDSIPLMLLLLGALFTYAIQALCMYATKDNAILLVSIYIFNLD